jgi:hypothetical protein
VSHVVGEGISTAHSQGDLSVPADTERMSETSQPRDRADASGQQPEQPPAAAQPPELATATQQAPTRPAHTRRTWVAAAAIGAALLLGGGVGGYFIGAAADDDRPDPWVGTRDEFWPGDRWPGGWGEWPGGPPWHDRNDR